MLKNKMLLILAIKKMLDGGAEILELKHKYDLSNEEIEQVLKLYDDEEHL